jgi:hypothetical protein
VGWSVSIVFSIFLRFGLILETATSFLFSPVSKFAFAGSEQYITRNMWRLTELENETKTNGTKRRWDRDRAGSRQTEITQYNWSVRPDQLALFLKFRL